MRVDGARRAPTVSHEADRDGSYAASKGGTTAHSIIAAAGFHHAAQAKCRSDCPGRRGGAGPDAPRSRGTTRRCRPQRVAVQGAAHAFAHHAGRVSRADVPDDRRRGPALSRAGRRRRSAASSRVRGHRPRHHDRRGTQDRAGSGSAARSVQPARARAARRRAAGDPGRRRRCRGHHAARGGRSHRGRRGAAGGARPVRRRVAAHRRIGARHQARPCRRRRGRARCNASRRRRSAARLCGLDGRARRRHGASAGDRIGVGHRADRPRAGHGRRARESAEAADGGAGALVRGGSRGAVAGGDGPLSVRAGKSARGRARRIGAGDEHAAGGISGDPDRIHGGRRVAHFEAQRADAAHQRHRDARRRDGAVRRQDRHPHRKSHGGAMFRDRVGPAPARRGGRRCRGVHSGRAGDAGDGRPGVRGAAVRSDGNRAACGLGRRRCRRIPRKA